MEALLIYTGKVALLLAAFYLFYKWLLSRETFHRMNRMILVGTLLVAALLPFCVVTLHRTIEVPDSIAAAQSADPNPASNMLAETSDEAETTMTGSPSRSAAPLWLTMLFAIYLAGVVAALTRTAISAIRVHRLIRQGELQYDADGTKIIVTDRDISPFSWMQWIVLSSSDYEEASPFILSHEKAHLAFGHSREVLLAELFCDLQWFNPSAWLLKRELRAIHEYEADDAVLRGGVDVKAYQYSLIKKAVGMSGYSITNSFHHSTLKNRITMMSKSKSPMLRGLRVLYVLPLVACFLIATAHTVTDYKSSEKNSVFRMEIPESSAPVDKRTEPVFFKMTRGDAVADTLFLFIRLFAPNEVDGLSAYGPIYYKDVPKVLEGNYHLVSLDAEPSCKMGFIDDVKTLMRDAGKLRVRYACSSSGQEVAYRMLPPTEENGVKQGFAVSGQIEVPKQALLKIQVNSQGRIRLAGKEAALENLQPALTTLLRERMPEYLIYLQTDRATEFGTYVAVQNAITGSITMLRDEYTKVNYNKPYDPSRFGYAEGLSEEELIATQKAVPQKLIENDDIKIVTR